MMQTKTDAYARGIAPDLFTVEISRADPVIERRAQLAVASRCENGDECRELLATLGLLRRIDV